MGKKFGNIELIHGDCMEYMRSLPDYAFDLAVVDVPYGIGADKDALNRCRTKNGNAKCSNTEYHYSGWDNSAPTEDYFKELFRVSRNQIIWGANHFISKIPYDSSCWIVWDKDNGNNDYADCELAWTSFPKAVRKFKWRWHGMLQENMRNKEKRIHPCQKPIALYAWIYDRYGKDCKSILDTHLGSASSAIAALDWGGKFVGIEIDEEYFNNAIKRVEKQFEERKSKLDL